MTRTRPPDTNGSRLAAIAGMADALSGELGLDELLDHVVELAREVTGASYAALGVLGDAVTRSSEAEWDLLPDQPGGPAVFEVDGYRDRTWLRLVPEHVNGRTLDHPD